jgi:hypothetical protein
MPIDSDPGAVARAGAGGNRVSADQLPHITTERDGPGRSDFAHHVQRVRNQALAHLSEAADRLDYWMFCEGWEGREPFFLAQFLRDIRAAVASIRARR